MQLNQRTKALGTNGRREECLNKIGHESFALSCTWPDVSCTWPDGAQCSWGSRQQVLAPCGSGTVTANQSNQHITRKRTPNLTTTTQRNVVIFGNSRIFSRSRVGRARKRSSDEHRRYSPPNRCSSPAAAPAATRRAAAIQPETGRPQRPRLP